MGGQASGRRTPGTKSVVAPSDSPSRIAGDLVIRRPCDGCCYQTHRHSRNAHPDQPLPGQPTVRGDGDPRHRPGCADPESVDPEAAAAFLTQFYAETSPKTSFSRRLREMRREIAATGSYRHTTEELTFGARVAWRNSARCIGRLYWNSLRVRDRREIDDPAQVAEECVEHLRDATRDGRIRSTITIFAPDRPGRARPAHPQRPADPLRRAPDALG